MDIKDFVPMPNWILVRQADAPTDLMGVALPPGNVKVSRGVVVACGLLVPEFSALRSGSFSDMLGWLFWRLLVWTKVRGAYNFSLGDEVVFSRLESVSFSDAVSGLASVVKIVHIKDVVAHKSCRWGHD